MSAKNVEVKSRMTRQRRIILDELRRTDTHPTAEELYEMVRRRIPRISLGTVYRNLEMLCDTGMVLKLELGGGRRRFDGNVQTEHYHARCLSCNRVSDVAGEVVQEISYRVDDLDGFLVTGHQLTFMGVCAACAASQGSA